jgi:DNA-binding response OmpR family regulator
MIPHIPFPVSSLSLDEGLQHKEGVRYIKQTRVFIVDDTEVILHMTWDYLKRRRFRVFAARNGLELVRRAHVVRPDLIVLDIQMPGMDGLDVIRLIRAHADAVIAAVPIIAITALSAPGGRNSCLNAGANEHVYKPLNLNELEKIIKRLLPTHYYI